MQPLTGEDHTLPPFHQIVWNSFLAVSGVAILLSRGEDIRKNPANCPQYSQCYMDLYRNICAGSTPSRSRKPHGANSVMILTTFQGLKPTRNADFVEGTFS